MFILNTHYGVRLPVSFCSCVQWLAAIGRPFRMAVDAARRWTTTDDDDSTVQEQQSNDEHKDDETTTKDDSKDEIEEGTSGEETFKSHRDSRPYGK